MPAPRSSRAQDGRKRGSASRGAVLGAEVVSTDPENGSRQSVSAHIGVQTFWMMLPPIAVARLSPNARAQSHWPRTRARQEVMEHTSVVARVQELRPVREPVEITFRWVVPNRIKRDIDNLAGNGVVKAVLDALVADAYLVDDSSRYVTAVRTEMVHEMGSRRLEIVIAPAPAAPAARRDGE